MHLVTDIVSRFIALFLTLFGRCGIGPHTLTEVLLLSLQAKVNMLNSAVIVIRLLRDLCNRVPTWTPLSGWVRPYPLGSLDIGSCSCCSSFCFANSHTHPAFLLSARPQPLELLVEKVISTSERPMGPGESLRRVFECVATGILLSGEPKSELSQLGSRADEIFKLFYISPLKLASS